MNILYITAQYPTKTGEEFIRHEAFFLKKMHNIFFFPIRDCYSLYKLIKLNQFRTQYKQKNKCLIDKDLIQILRCLGKAKTSKELFSNIFSLLVAFLLFIYFKRKELDHIHCEWSSTTASVGYFLSILLGVPFSFCCHRGDILQKNLLPEKISRAKFVRCISVVSKKMLYEFTKFKTSKTEVLMKGVLISKKIVKQDYNKKIIYLFSIGSIDQIKGHLNFIKAIKEILHKDERVFYVIFGSGSYQNRINTYLNGNNLTKKVLLKGYTTPERISSWIFNTNSFKIYVHPSRSLVNHQHEGIPVALLECMSFGIPVIGSDSGGTREIWHEKRYSFCRKPTSQYFRKSLIQMLKMTKSQTQSIIKRNRKIIMTDFNASVQSKKLSNLMAK